MFFEFYTRQVLLQYMNYVFYSNMALTILERNTFLSQVLLSIPNKILYINFQISVILQQRMDFFFFLPNSALKWTSLSFARSLSKIGQIKQFKPSVAFCIKTSHLICCVNQVNGFYMKCNTGLKWFTYLYSIWNRFFEVFWLRKSELTYLNLFEFQTNYEGDLKLTY